MTDTTTQLSAIDILINRQNIAVARSQKLLQSWLPRNPSSQPTTSTIADSDEDDFQDLGEASGIGAKRKNSDESDLGGILKRRRTDTDKLLENLIGKKAAQARKKAQEAGKGKHAAPKSLEAQKQKIVRNDVESKDEEEGRTSAFGSRKKKRLNAKRGEEDGNAVGGGEDGNALDGDAEPPGSMEDAAVVKDSAREAESSGSEDERPKKRKAGSYLDELLAQKAKKKKNKMKKKGKSDA